METSRTQTKNTIRTLLFLLLLLAAMLVMYKNISPLYPYNYGADSAYFRLFGSALLEGKTLYADMWDHKGPILFFIQAVGALAGTENRGLNLIFLIHYVNLVITAFLMFRIYKVFPTHSGSRISQHSYRPYYLASFCAFVVFFRVIEGGNSTEDISLPYITVCLFLIMKYASEADARPEHPLKYAVVYGACLGIIAFIRVNNAVSVCAGIACIGVYLIMKRKWKNLFRNIAAGLAGLLLILIPLFLYHISHHTLREMLYATFGYNMKYLNGWKETSIGDWERYLPIWISLLLMAIHILRKKAVSFTDILILSMIIANGLMFLKANRYLHYFAVFCPVLTVTLLYTINDMKIPELSLTALLTAAFIVSSLPYFPTKAKIVSPYRPYENSKFIPKTERNSVLGYDIIPDFYLVSGIRPYDKYYAFQTSYFSVDPKMGDEYYAWLRENKPAWIVTLHFHQTDVIAGILNESYTRVFNDRELDYWHLSELCVDTTN